MIDLFSLALTHGLMMLAAWRVMTRVDLDNESPPAPFAKPGSKKDTSGA